MTDLFFIISKICCSVGGDFAHPETIEMVNIKTIENKIFFIMISPLFRRFSLSLVLAVCQD